MFALIEMKTWKNKNFFKNNSKIAAQCFQFNQQISNCIAFGKAFCSNVARLFQITCYTHVLRTYYVCRIEHMCACRAIHTTIAYVYALVPTLMILTYFPKAITHWLNALKLIWLYNVCKRFLFKQFVRNSFW